MALFSLLDHLYCQEDPLEEKEIELEDNENDLHLIASEAEDESDSTEVFLSLTSNEQKTHPDFPPDFPEVNNQYLRSARKETVEWVARASKRYGFSALTVLLAVNYLDRCFLSAAGLRLHEDKPWMKQLSAVACLSLAAKVEETYVPHLLDLQVAEEVTGYMFEAKTIRRMELLVLSTLSWRMNPVSPLSFIWRIIPKLKNHNQQEILRRCEAILLSVIADWRWVRHPPSVWAAAVLMQQLDDSHHLMDLCNIPKERVEECSGIILELTSCFGVGNKRKNCYSDPPSPNGVIGSCFSCESSSSSGDSWAMCPSLDSYSPPFKKPNCSII